MAHYDDRPADATDGVSRATGANDNGSGVALLLETARIMSSREWNQTVVFLATSAEEQGSFGARYFAENAFLDNMNIIAALNYDAVGGRAGIPQHARLFAVQYAISRHGALGRYYEYVAGLYLPTFPVLIQDALDRDGRWGDHREFVAVGFPAIRVIESVEDPELLNSNRDTWDLIDYNYLQRIVQINLAVAANLAGGPQQPQPPLVATMAEPGAYMLTWPVDPVAAGYAISFRPEGNGIAGRDRVHRPGQHVRARLGHRGHEGRLRLLRPPGQVGGHGQIDLDDPLKIVVVDQVPRVAVGIQQLRVFN
ncbi:MAG TPA: M20/M25/M40 family metallo-hydrolase [Promineifilum sp.]|nr:M20/M25/M40 family metallo-hydrolase [Promineifilum sp.]